MGQPVAVVQHPSSRPGIVRYELNRVLTGTGHESYRAGQPVIGDRPPDLVARRVFEQVPGVQSIGINASIVTVQMDPKTDADKIAEVISDLYTYYLPGVPAPSPEDFAG